MTLRVDSIQTGGSGAADSEAGWKWHTHDMQGREAETAIAASLRRKAKNPDDNPPESSTVLDHLQTREEIEDRNLAEKQEADAKLKKELEEGVKEEARLLASASEKNELAAYGDTPVDVPSSGILDTEEQKEEVKSEPVEAEQVAAGAATVEVDDRNLKLSGAAAEESEDDRSEPQLPVAVAPEGLALFEHKVGPTQPPPRMSSCSSVHSAT